MSAALSGRAVRALMELGLVKAQNDVLRTIITDMIAAMRNGCSCGPMRDVVNAAESALESFDDEVRKEQENSS